MFHLWSQPLWICGWLLSHSSKRWSKLADSDPCRHRFPPQNGSLLPPSAESPVAPATESQSQTTRDTIRLIVRGSLGSCSSSSECELAHLVSHTQRSQRDMNGFYFIFWISALMVEKFDKCKAISCTVPIRRQAEWPPVVAVVISKGLEDGTTGSVAETVASVLRGCLESMPKGEISKVTSCTVNVVIH